MSVLIEDVAVGTTFVDRFRGDWAKPLSLTVTAASMGYVFFTAAMNPDFVATRPYSPSALAITLLILCVNGFAASMFSRSPVYAFVIAVGAMAILAVLFHDRAAAVTPLYWYSLLLLSMTVSGFALWSSLLASAAIDTLVGAWSKIPRSDGLNDIVNSTVGSTTTLVAQVAVNVAVSYTVVVCIGRLIAQHQRRSHAHSVQIAKFQRERDRDVEQAVASERTRMARELHDVSAHHLTAVIVQAKAARAVLASHPDEIGALLDGVIDQGDQALKSMRQLVDVLRIEQTSTPSPQPLIHDLEGLAARCREAGLSVHLRVAGPVDRLDDAVQLSCYRIVQECLSNVMRHAPGACAYVTIQETPDVLSIEVLNRLTGTTCHEPGRAGLGLVGMRERAELFGGSLTVETTDSGWWKVSAELPTEGVISR
ncbi:sensor histidine kinase [Prescottella equi]